ncbi:MAG: cation transporter dimerization domain-containing protein, partial [Pyrobaculum sp.]
REAHEIADAVEKKLRKELGGEVIVHVEPHSITSPPPSPVSQSPQEPSEPPSQSPQ